MAVSGGGGRRVVGGVKGGGAAGVGRRAQRGAPFIRAAPQARPWRAQGGRSAARLSNEREAATEAARGRAVDRAVLVARPSVSRHTHLPAPRPAPRAPRSPRAGAAAPHPGRRAGAAPGGRPPASPFLPAAMDNYVVTDMIGEGSFGKVWGAREAGGRARRRQDARARTGARVSAARAAAGAS